MLHTFLLIGQSNMAGRGFPAEAMPVDLSRIRLLRNGLWTGAFRPFSADRGFAGVSLAESFVEAYAAERNVEVGVVACADGGTRLAQWMPGQPLYENAVFQTKLAMRSSQLAGILWHQGESDMAPQLWPQYEENFRDAPKTVDVPVQVFVIGDIWTMIFPFEVYHRYGPLWYVSEFPYFYLYLAIFLIFMVDRHVVTKKAMASDVLKSNFFLHQLKLFEVFSLQCQSHTSGPDTIIRRIPKLYRSSFFHHVLLFHTLLLSRIVTFLPRFLILTVYTRILKL